MALEFDMRFDPRHGEAVEVAENIVRVTAPNASPFTFHGTNSYIIGSRELAVIDPGPPDDSHLSALLRAIDGRPVSHIFVTHTHRDHSPLAKPLAEATGARLLAEGPHRPARPVNAGEDYRLDASNDVDFRPDRALADQELVEGDGWALRAVLTPGHAANHAAFALEGTGILFSGDHVMGWSTTVVAPPDGAMADYMASLDRLLERDTDRLYLSGHGGAIENPKTFVRGLKTHRKMRERAILERIVQGDRRIPDIVKAIYRDTDPRLFGAAGMSVLAHLEDLAARGAIATDGPPAFDGEFRPG
ncbi:MBL fold metallo-hydrolase [Mesorhizobium sp. LHD-90]|uniref:MBL fold metallo-hydrolase n=1 Tax=Mesorhizobium sp. LHD-90 TaxID=3071414 RepID=UPI0027E1CB55|nr:MBL fold metallo-hydrolase [Mesorhizobium sp. LHD-90]MDQ6435933.1 MBL fold metallo-hydrolase [Mesorhizobium sp. LHD-90]